MSPCHLYTCTSNIKIAFSDFLLLANYTCLFAALGSVSTAAIRLSIPSLERLGGAVTAEQVTSVTNSFVSWLIMLAIKLSGSYTYSYSLLFFHCCMCLGENSGNENEHPLGHYNHKHQQQTASLFNKRRYAKSPTVQDAFWPIQSLVTCTGVTGRWGLHRMQSGGQKVDRRSLKYCLFV